MTDGPVDWLETFSNSTLPRIWIERTKASVEHHGEEFHMDGEETLQLCLSHEGLRDALTIAVASLRKLSWEGSSVNYPARMALNEIRERLSKKP